jgi:FMN phosphatase YigB (HAD superfamily)
MFSVQRQPVPDDSTAYEIARALSAWVAPRVQAGIKGAAEAVHILHRACYRLCLASAGDATSLSGYLEGMGIRHCIDRPYGVDLVGVPKTSPEFYQAIFRDATVDPGEAVVIDDRLEAAAWARQAGAGLVLLVGEDIASLTSLPRRLGLTDHVE